MPKTIDNTRVYGSSYLTSDPTAASASSKRAATATATTTTAAAASSSKHKSPFPREDGEESDPDADDDEDDDESIAPPPSSAVLEEINEPELDPEGGIHAIPSNRGLGRDPKILLTTSAKATRDTYTFAEELRGIFPGGEFFKRPVGRFVLSLSLFEDSWSFHGRQKGGERLETKCHALKASLLAKAFQLSMINVEWVRMAWGV